MISIYKLRGEIKAVEDDLGFFVGDTHGQWPVTWDKRVTALCCMCQSWLETGSCDHTELVWRCLEDGKKIEIPEGKKMKLNGGNVIRELNGDRFEVICQQDSKNLN